ncbi:uncharacterized protein LOC142233590 isoform X2 [Haematobia irritans]
MQDISRDDFSILNGGDTITTATNSITDKDMCPSLISRIPNASPINSNSLTLSKHLNPVDDNAASAAFDSNVKLEDTNTVDLFPSHPSTWQQHPMNSHELAHHRLPVHNHRRYDHSSNSKLLLQGSDDPLISHGANSVLSHDDEHPADFAKCLLTTQAQATFSASTTSGAIQPEPPQQKQIKSGCSNLTKQQLKVKANLMSARNQQQQQQQRENNVVVAATQATGPRQRTSSTKAKKKPNNSVKLRFHHQALPPEYLSHYEATQGQVRTAARPSKSTQRQTRNSHENVRSWLQKIAEIQRTANASKSDEQISTNGVKPRQQPLDANNNPHNQQRPQSHTSTSTPIIRSNGEMSNVKTIIKDQVHKRSHYYSDLPYMGEITLDNSKPRRGRKPKKADICHLIYKNYGTILPKRKSDTQHTPNNEKAELKYRPDTNDTRTANGEDQPLNLCLRDQTADTYSISSADDASESNSSCPTPPITTPSDFDRDSMLANNLQNSLTNLNELDNEVSLPSKMEKDIPEVPLSHAKSEINDDSVLHPITMYYQKLLESGVLLHNAKTIQKDNKLALKIPIPRGFFLPSKIEKTNATSMPSNANSLGLPEYPEQMSTPSSIKSENSSVTNASSSTTIMGSSCSSLQQHQQQTPQKRKRSAIFIPPMNIENSSNPATEVSICKFKFTGGSKPTLEEKKMLSVDAGGNYRYFSGTGDKTTRGYEYFPREMFHTAGLVPGVNCSGQKLLVDIPPPSAGLSNELLQIPETSNAHLLIPQPINCNAAASKTPPPTSPTPTFLDVGRNENGGDGPKYVDENLECLQSASNTNRFVISRKKQALHQLRKTTQREKLEKTFKEQGFLIQTQQLESAEGATYCKFRQLKKFTRYLFRNWKDYLPDELQAAHGGNDAVLAAEEYANRNTEDVLTTNSQNISPIVEDITLNNGREKQVLE